MAAMTSLVHHGITRVSGAWLSTTGSQKISLKLGLRNSKTTVRATSRAKVGAGQTLRSVQQGRIAGVSQREYQERLGTLQGQMSSAIGFLEGSCPTFEKNRLRSEQRGGWIRTRVSQDDQPKDQDQDSLSTTTPPSSSPVSARRAAEKARVEKGQRTAIVTGVISVMLGVGYLILTQLLDTRGVNLIPPPLEAFNP